jgi:hypothetical protein
VSDVGGQWVREGRKEEDDIVLKRKSCLERCIEVSE